MSTVRKILELYIISISAWLSCIRGMLYGVEQFVNTHGLY